MKSKMKGGKVSEPELDPQVAELMGAIEKRAGKAGMDVDQIRAELDKAKKAAAGPEGDYGVVRGWIEERLGQSAEWQSVLRQSLERIHHLEDEREQRELYSDAWMARQRTRIDRIYRANPEEGMRNWANLYARLLIDAQYGLAGRLAGEQVRAPRGQARVVKQLRAAAEFLESEQYARALPGLNLLAPLDGDPLLGVTPEQAAALLILSARIALYHAKDMEPARLRIARAAMLAPQDPRISAAQGELYLQSNEPDKALVAFQVAISGSSAVPDGYLGMGRYFELQNDPGSAGEWYERAADTVAQEPDPLRALSRLLAPANGNAYLQLAFVLKSKRPDQAFRAVELARKREISDQLLASRLYVELLTTLGRTQEARDAGYEAGRDLYWKGDYNGAIELFKTAHALDEQYAPVLWYLADACMVLSSYPTENRPVDARLIEEGRAAWYKALKLGLPGSDFAWVYTTRALLNDMQSRLPESEPRRWDLLWEAVAFNEQAVLLKPDGTYHWPNLMGEFRGLGLYQNTMYVADEIGELLPDEPDSSHLGTLDELAAVYADTGEWDHALETINKAIKIQDHHWRRYVLAYIEYNRKEYPTALEEIRKAIPEDPRSISYRMIEASALRKMNELEDARKAFSALWAERTDPDTAGYEESLAYAGFYLATLGRDEPEMALLDEAMTILESQLADPIHGPSSQRSLGQFLLVRGDEQRGDYRRAGELLEAGLRASTRTEDLREVEEDLQSSAHLIDQDQAAAVLEQVKATIAERRQWFSTHAGPQKELQRILETSAEPGSPAWAGATATLARLYADEGRWEDALSSYTALDHATRQGKAEFSQAGYGVRLARGRLAEQGDAAFKEREFGAALQKYQAAQAFTPEDGAGARAAGELRVALARYARGERNLAGEGFRRALSEPGLQDGKALGELARDLLVDPEMYWDLRDAWQPLTGGLPDEALTKAGDALLALDTFLERYLAAGAADSSTHDLAQLSTPIAIEMSMSLVPEDTSENWPVFGAYIPAMRARLQAETGVVVPGIRLRGNEGDLPDGSYLIMLYEVPRILNYVYPGNVYAHANSDWLTEIGARGSIQSPNPLTNAPGAWVPLEDIEYLEDHNVPYWEDPLEYMIYNLEAFLRINLDQFMGLQETQATIERWEIELQLNDQVKSCLPDRASRQRFSKLLRALLREGVPINRPVEILSVVAETGLPDDLDAVLKAVRLRLRDQLPGNAPVSRVLAAPRDLEDEMLPWVQSEPWDPVLAAPPNDVQDWLRVVRELVTGETPEVEALVVENPRLRLGLRRMVELEFPNLAVLSREELLAGEVPHA